MANYGISKEAIADLERLSEDLKKFLVEIYEASDNMITSIQSQDGLGVFRSEIISLLKEIVQITKTGGESIEYLANKKIPERISKIEELLKMLDDYSSDGNNPYQKTLHF
jgi:hypothetical protein